jgi:hypothetical protein
MGTILLALLLSPGFACLGLGWLAWSSGQPGEIHRWRRPLLPIGLLLTSVSIVAIVVVVIIGSTEPPWGVRTMTSRWAAVNIWMALIGVVCSLFGTGRARLLAGSGGCLGLFYWFALVNTF